MAIVSTYSDKQLLIIDDLPEMRSSLRAQVASLGFEKTTLVGNVRDALDQLKSRRFDIILCDYYLGGGTDGQQLLEFLRTRRIISRAVLFIMITAETGYEGVVTAAECLPDDYLLKPFTAETLRARFDRLLDKKARLARIDKLQDQGRWADIVAACDEIIAARDKYLADALRIKGNALIMAGRFAEAVAFYREALQLRAMPWAKLGLARALAATGEGGQAKATLHEIIAETPRFLAAYDLLGRLHKEEGEAAQALEVLERACAVSPNALARHRAIAGVAEQMADYRRVEQAMSAVVQKTRHTPLREAADFASLGSALTEMGEADRALAVIEDAKGAFKERGDATLFAAVEAVTQRRAGNEDAARQALDRALAGDVQALPAAAALAVAKACLVHGRQTEAEAVLKHVVQNNPDQTALHASVTRLAKEHGGAELAERLVSASVAEVIQLNNDAVRKGQAGEFAAAAEMLRDAAERLPGNAQIVGNAAYALLLDVLMNGMAAEKIRDAMRYRENLATRDPGHPKLREIADLLAKVRDKYKLVASQ